MVNKKKVNSHTARRCAIEFRIWKAISKPYGDFCEMLAATRRETARKEAQEAEAQAQAQIAQAQIAEAQIAGEE